MLFVNCTFELLVPLTLSYTQFFNWFKCKLPCWYFQGLTKATNLSSPNLDYSSTGGVYCGSDKTVFLIAITLADYPLLPARSSQRT